MAAPKPIPLHLLPDDIRALIERDGPYCVWCSRLLGLTLNDCTREHVIPRSRGGKDTLNNFLLACSGCNHQRRSESVQSWASRCERLGLKVRFDLIEAALERTERGDVVKLSKLSRRQRLERKRRQRANA